QIHFSQAINYQKKSTTEKIIFLANGGKLLFTCGPSDHACGCSLYKRESDYLLTLVDKSVLTTFLAEDAGRRKCILYLTVPNEHIAWTLEKLLKTYEGS